MWPITASMAGAPSEFAFDEADDAALLTRDEDAVRVLRVSISSRPAIAADVTDDAAEPGAQQTQLAMVALELLGVGHSGQPSSLPAWQRADRTGAAARRVFGQADNAFDRGMLQLGVGREGDVLWLHSGVRRHPLDVAGA